MRDEQGVMSPQVATKAVVLVGFGSPDPKHIRQFLTEIFSDPIASPFMRWHFLAKPFIPFLARFIARDTRTRYESISGSKSSRQRVEELAVRLEGRFLARGGQALRVAVAMRYGEPSLSTILSALAVAGVEDVLIVPLYPQGAIATVGSIAAEVRRVCNLPPCYDLRVRFAEAWYRKSDFVIAWVDAIRDALRAFPIQVRDRIHLLFTAHAIPIAHVIRRGDRYPEEVVQTTRLISDSLGNILATSIAYQSAPPWGAWTKPTVEEELSDLGQRGQRNCLIAPIGFLYDNVETLRDIDMDLLPRATEFGLERLKRVIPPIESPKIVDALDSLAKNWGAGDAQSTSEM